MAVACMIFLILIVLAAAFSPIPGHPFRTLDSGWLKLNGTFKEKIDLEFRGILAESSNIEQKRKAVAEDKVSIRNKGEILIPSLAKGTDRVTA